MEIDIDMWIGIGIEIMKEIGIEIKKRNGKRLIFLIFSKIPGCGGEAV